MILNQNQDFDFDFKIVLVTDFTDFNFSKSSKSLSMYSVAVQTQRICCSISRMLWFHQQMVLLLIFYILIILTAAAIEYILCTPTSWPIHTFCKNFKWPGHNSAMRHLIPFMFGSGVGFSGTADCTHHFRLDQIQDGGRRPSWKTSNGHISEKH